MEIKSYSGQPYISWTRRIKDCKPYTSAFPILVLLKKIIKGFSNTSRVKFWTLSAPYTPMLHLYKIESPSRKDISIVSYIKFWIAQIIIHAIYFLVLQKNIFFNFPHSSLCEILDLVTLTPYETCLISPTSLFHTRYDE